jgi:hypothetical protein
MMKTKTKNAETITVSAVALVLRRKKVMTTMTILSHRHRHQLMSIHHHMHFDKTMITEEALLVSTSIAHRVQHLAPLTLAVEIVIRVRHHRARVKCPQHRVP